MPTPTMIKALRNFAKSANPQTSDERLRDELEGQNDRASFLLLGSFVENAAQAGLLRAMRADLSNEDKEALFDGTGPLSSLSARIQAAYAFNVIDREARNQLMQLKEMRNACAHTRRHISLETPELATVCRAFLGGTESAEDWKNATAEQLKRALIFHCVTLVQYLLTGSKSAWEDAIKTAVEQYAAED